MAGDKQENCQNSTVNRNLAWATKLILVQKLIMFKNYWILTYELKFDSGNY
jgi:hypothetical protein